MNDNAAPLPLRDIHLPEPVSWWPIAPGWWLLALGIILLIIALVYVYRHWRKQQRRRDSLKAFNAIRTQFNQHRDRAMLLSELSVFMRRASITFYPRAVSAGLTGDAWLHFLAETSRQREAQNSFINGCGKLLATAPYLPKNSSLEIDDQALLALCEQWLRAQPDKKQAKSAQASLRNIAEYNKLGRRP
jgi:hypothetical protein